MGSNSYKNMYTETFPWVKIVIHTSMNETLVVRCSRFSLCCVAILVNCRMVSSFFVWRHLRHPALKPRCPRWCLMNYSVNHGVYKIIAMNFDRFEKFLFHHCFKFSSRFNCLLFFLCFKFIYYFFIFVDWSLLLFGS